MSINIKKYTKDQMAKMVEGAQAEVQELRRVNSALTEQIDQMNGEAINKANEIANLKADLDASKAASKLLNDQGQDYWRAWQASKKDVTDQRNKLAESEKELSEHRAATVRRLDELKKQLADTEAALGRANAELTHSVAEKNALRNDVTKMTDRAAFECGRANYAEAHPWKNLWAWVKREAARHE